MQIAINVLIFVCGFAIAALIGSKPKQSRLALDDFLSKLRYVTNGFKRSAPSASPSFNEKDTIVAIDGHDLYTKAQVEEMPEDSWERIAYEDVKDILLMRKPGASKFPCVYATAGYKHNEHRYIFMHSEDVTEPRNLRKLATAMRAYLPISHDLGANTSLVITFPKSEKKEYSVEDYQQKFWDLLRGLRTCDLKPWPKDIPTETSAPKWAFCFDGVPWFPAAMTPAHEQRQSRHAPNFTIAMQPKWVFDNLFKTPEKRRAAVEAVRKLMPDYDILEPSPDLSAYGTEGTTEAHQYYLLDENVTSKAIYHDLDQ